MYKRQVSGLTSFKEIASDIKGKVETIVHTCECIEPDEEIKKLVKISCVFGWKKA